MISKAFHGGLFLLVCVGAFAADDTEQEQRIGIRRGREAAETRHAEREQTCRKQFVVTPCLEKARIEKYEAMQVLRAQEVLLDEAERKRRSQAQIQRVEARQAAASASEQSPAASAAERLRHPRAPKAPKAMLPQAVRAAAPSASGRASAEQRKREVFDERQREIETHRQAVEKRNAQRAATKPVRPLPVPSATSAASR